MMGDKYSFLPFTLNSVTSVTHFSLGRFASKLRFRRLSQIRPCSPLYERYFLTRIRLLIPSSDRKSTRLNSSHVSISYAVFCLKKKKECISELCPVKKS